MSDNPDIIYYNITRPGTGGARTNAIYTKNNSEPIVWQPDLYKLAVVRLSVPTNVLPIFIAQRTGVDKDELVYTVTLRYNGFEHTTNLRMISVSPDAYGEYIEEYYYIYTYSQFLDMINVALATCFTALGLLTTLPINALVPFFVFDAPSQLIQLYTTLEYKSDLALPIEIYVNERLFEPYMNAFYVTYYLTNSIKRAKFNILDTKLNTIDIGGTDYLITTNNYNILNTWNDVRSIQITTSVPVGNEYIELNYGSKYGGISEITRKDVILKDFIILYPEYASVARTTIDYSVNEFEYIDLHGHEPLRNISVNVYWINREGERKPLYITSSNVLHIKLMFKKKTFV